jgi:hypothetical protein
VTLPGWCSPEQSVSVCKAANAGEARRAPRGRPAGRRPSCCRDLQLGGGEAHGWWSAVMARQRWCLQAAPACLVPEAGWGGGGSQLAGVGPAALTPEKMTSGQPAGPSSPCQVSSPGRRRRCRCHHTWCRVRLQRGEREEQSTPGVERASRAAAASVAAHDCRAGVAAATRGCGAGWTVWAAAGQQQGSSRAAAGQQQRGSSRAAAGQQQGSSGAAAGQQQRGSSSRAARGRALRALMRWAQVGPDGVRGSDHPPGQAMLQTPAPRSSAVTA